MLVTIAKADRTTTGRSRVTLRWFHCFSLSVQFPDETIGLVLHENVFVGASMRFLVRMAQFSSVGESRSENASGDLGGIRVDFAE